MSDPVQASLPFTGHLDGIDPGTPPTPTFPAPTSSTPPGSPTPPTSTTPPTPPTPQTPPTPLRGTRLRYALVLILDRHGQPLTLTQLADRLAGVGLVPTRQPATRAISDILRTERRLGRVRRVRRGTYVIGDLSRQTRWKMRRRLDGLGVVW